MQAGRLDWVNVLNELTTYDLRVFQTFDNIEGIGERRNDRRWAVGLSLLLSAISGQSVDAQECLDILHAEDSEEKDKLPTPKQSAEDVKAIFSTLGR